jgi:predicted peptidase
MRNGLYLILLMLVFISTGYSQDKVKVNYDFLLSLPDDYAGNKEAYPLVIYLHGGSHRGNDLSKLKGYGLPHLVEKGEKFNFIIASPQCPDEKYWSTENWFDSLYISLTNQYRIDTNRIYLTGISMGGYGVFITAMDFPDKFAAIVPLCGGCNDSDMTRICNLKDTPTWVFHGTDDDLIPISESERIVEALEDCNGNIKFTRLAGEGHGIQYLYEKMPDIYDWMLQQKRKDRLN